MLKFFIPISKVDAEKREVWGIATAEEIDKQGEVVAYQASKKAFADWSDYFAKATAGESLGNVREMHQPSAAGKAIHWEAVDDTRQISLGTKIIDEQAWQKCVEHVYIGFSVGGNPTRQEKRKVKGRTVNVITAYELVEVSLVDNPACPSAVFSVLKREPPKAQHGQTAEDQVAAGDAGGSSGSAPDPEKRQPRVSDADPDLQPPGEAESVKVEEEPETEKKEPTTIQTLIFDKDKFSEAEAKSWASSHDFKSGKTDITENSIRIRQRDPGDFKDDMRTISLKPGVQAVIGHLKADLPKERFGAILGRLHKQLWASGPSAYSELTSILPALEALRNLVQAMDSEVAEHNMGHDRDVEAGDVAVLTASAEAILEFVDSELRQQLRSLAASGGAAEEDTVEAVTRLEALRKALSPGQLAKLKDDKDFKENMTVMHKMGHALAKATYAMGADCPHGKCAMAEPDDGDDKDESDAEKADQITDPGKDTRPPDAHASPAAFDDLKGKKPGTKPTGGEPEEPSAPAQFAGDKPKKAPGVKDVGEPILQALTKVLDEVKAIVGPIKSMDGRLEKLEAQPAAIGRPVSTREKALGGTAPPSSQGIEVAIVELRKLADQTPNAVTREEILKQIATIQIRQIQAGSPADA